MPAALAARGEAILGVGHHDPHDRDTVLPEHVQGGHAEMAGADEGNAHGCPIRLATASSPDNTSGRPVTTRAAFATVINNAPGGGAPTVRNEFRDCGVGPSGASMRAWHRLGANACEARGLSFSRPWSQPLPARAGGPPYPAVPPEVGVAPFIGPTWDTYRCAEGPVINFYHGAYYGQEPPALYRGYAYRPHYRYSAYRRLPRKYFCVTD